MFKLPIEFNAHAMACENFPQPWTVESGPNQTICAIPAEFGGKGGGLSPEDLFLQASMNCFIGTFKVVAGLSKLIFGDIKVLGRLLVDKNDQGKVVMKSIHLDILISQVGRPDRIDAIVKKVIRDGFILNSIKSELTYHLTHTPADEPATNEKI